jgi:hypothetical protein
MRKYRSTVTNGTQLEPRVAQLEVGLDRLTDDVANLANVVREQGSQMEQEIQKLVVAVTQAAAPRKTDWSTIIAGVMLILAIGSAAFWPLSQTVQENKQTIEQIRQDVVDHKQLQLHPVGMALVQRLESQLQDHVKSNEKMMESHMNDAKEMHAVLEKHFEEMIASQQKIHDLELKALKEKVDLHNDRIYGRVVKLEDQERMEGERDRDELQMWRLKAMGLSVSPNVNTHTHEVVEQSPTKK